jgi:valyl-tRNA synthetase
MQHKADLLKKSAEINWHPSFMQNRMDIWTEGLMYDWNVSRQRYFGVPLPVWYRLDAEGNPDLEDPILPTQDQLPVDPMSDTPAGFTEAQRNQPSGFRGETDVFDTWFTSSLSPQINSHWITNPERHERLFPADIRPQAHEIIRTWAFYTIAKAMLHEDKIPWEHVVVSGWVLAADGSKTGKSKGNATGTPADFMDKYTSDGVRYWSAKAKLGVDTIFDESVMKNGRRLVTKLYNAGKFVYSQPGFKTPVTHEIDKGFLQEVQKLVAMATKGFEDFDHAKALADTETFFWNNLTDTYLELVKKRAFDATEETKSESGSAIAALRIGLEAILRLFAPFIPYITEELWSWSAAEDTGHPSIHRAPWPTEDEFEQYDAPEDAESFNTVVAALAAVHKHKSESGVSVGTSMSDLTIEAAPEVIVRLEHCLGDLQNAARAESVVLTATNDEIEGGFRITGTFIEKDKS